MNIKNLSPELKKRFAVGYLVTHQEECPDNLKRYIDKLKHTEDEARLMNNKMEEARKTIEECENAMNQIFGSMNAIIELASEDLPENQEKIDGWASKFEPPMREPNITGRNPVQKAGSTDMAGSTSKIIPPSTVMPSPGSEIPGRT